MECFANVLFVMALGMLLVGCGSAQLSELSPSPTALISSDSLSAESSLSKSSLGRSMLVSPSPLVVNGDRLWQSLEAIVGFDDRFSGAGRSKVRSFLVGELTGLGWKVEQQVFTDKDGVEAENLIATKTWGDTSAIAAQRWIVGAHYDTIENTPGADDNGTGVAALLELAHLFAGVSIKTDIPVSLELIFFDLEEAGLQGSFAYTQRPENLEGLQGAIVLEMLGYACVVPGCQQYPKNLLIEPPSDRGDFLAVVGDAEHPEMLAGFSPDVQGQFIPSDLTDLKIFTLSVPLKGALTPDVLRSDHAPFWLQDIGAVMVTDTAYLRNPHYHQVTDTLETIDRPFFVRSSQAVANALGYYLGKGAESE